MAHLDLFKKIWWAITIHIVLLALRYLISQIQGDIPFAHPSTTFSFSWRHGFISNGKQAATSGMPCLFTGVKTKARWDILSLNLIHYTQKGKLCLWSSVAIGDIPEIQHSEGQWSLGGPKSPCSGTIISDGRLLHPGAEVGLEDGLSISKYRYVGDKNLVYHSSSLYFSVQKN